MSQSIFWFAPFSKSSTEYKKVDIIECYLKLPRIHHITNAWVGQDQSVLGLKDFIINQPWKQTTTDLLLAANTILMNMHTLYCKSQGLAVFRITF